MSIYEGENFETELVFIPAIKDLHRTLLEEDIKQQLSDPFDANVNCVETFNQQVEEILSGEDIDSDDAKIIRGEKLSFYTGIIELISDKYHLECDTETIAAKNLEEVSDICEAMYTFFVLKLKKNIKNMMLNYIMSNKKEICKSLDFLRKKKDVTTMSLRKKIEDPDISTIASNIQEVLNYIKSLDINMDEMIKYIDLDLYNNSAVNDLMLSSIIRSNFQVFYFSNLWGFQDCNYDDIISKIVNGLIKSMKKGE